MAEYTDKIEVGITMRSGAHLTTYNPTEVKRRVRRPEDLDAIEDAWDRTFGRDCEACGRRHARHSRCEEKGGVA